MRTKLQFLTFMFFMLLVKSITAQSCTCPYGSELLNNGTFDEAPFNASQTEFNLGVSYNPGTYMITNNTINKVPFTGGDYDHTNDHTPGAGNDLMLVVQSSNNTWQDRVWSEQVTIQPNSDYIFSFWAFKIKDNSGPTFNIVLKNNAGVIVKTIIASQGISNDHVWVQLESCWNSGSLSGTFSIEILETTTTGNRYFAIDDISLVKNTLDASLVSTPSSPTNSITVCESDTPGDVLNLTVTPNGAPLPSGTTYTWGKSPGPIMFPFPWNTSSLDIPLNNTANSGMYYVTVNVPGCPGRSYTFNVTILPKPNVSIGGPITACIGQCISLNPFLSPNPSTALSSSVTVNGTPLTLSGGNYNWCPSSSGNHTIVYTYTNSSGCTDSATVVVNIGANQWSKSSSNSLSIDDGKAVEVDNDHNIYVTGTYKTATSFDGAPVSGYTNTTGMYLAKYDECGILQWVSYTRSRVDETGVDLKIDENTGKIYVVGKCIKERVIFVDGQTTTTNLGSSSQSLQNGYFIARYNPNGSLDTVYAHEDQKVEPTGMDINKYPTGSYAGRIYVSAKNINNTSGQAILFRHTSNTSSINFLHKHASNVYYGNEAKDVAVDKYNRVYLVGSYRRIIFPGSTASLTASSMTNVDGFAVKFYDPVGATSPIVNWLKPTNIIGTNKIANVNTVSVNSYNQVYVGGNFNSSLNAPFSSSFGYPSSFFANGFVSRLNMWSGNAQWFTRIEGTNNYAVVRGVVSEDNKYVYAVGHYNGSRLKFFSGAGLNQYGTGTGGYHNAFVTRIKTLDGEDIWANYTRNITNGYHEAKNVAIFGSDKVYSVGRYNGQMLYGSGTANPLNSTSGTNDMFLTRNRISTGEYKTHDNNDDNTIDEKNTLEETSDIKYMMYPNPSSGVFNIKINQDFKNASISIKDLYGKIIINQNMNSKNKTINLSKAGLYFVTITIDSNSKTEKLIIK